jgi:peroxiredoxin
VYQQYKNQGVRVVGINLDTDGDVDKIKSMVSDMGLSFPILRDIRARYARELLVQNLPTLLVLDGEGKILEAHVGTSPDIQNELSAIVEDILAESSGKAEGEKAVKH